MKKGSCPLFYSYRIHPRSSTALMNAGRGKGVGETGVSPWRRAVSEASVENREVLKIKPARLIPRSKTCEDRTAGFIVESCYKRYASKSFSKKNV